MSGMIDVEARHPALWWNYKDCPLPTSKFSIDSRKDYPPSYRRHMRNDCYWVVQGEMNPSFDIDTKVTEERVAEVVRIREEKEAALMGKKLVSFE